MRARLADCHVRIRVHAEEASALAEALSGGRADPRIAESARALASYFGRALPLHAADEDQSVAPRLPELATLSAKLRAQHEAIEPLARILVADWEQLSTGARSALPDARAHFRHVVRLVDMLERHLVLEETELFPALDTLDPLTRRDIVREMRDRRA